MIFVIVYTERNKKTGQLEQIVSHGIDDDTGKIIVLPQTHPLNIGAKYDPDYGEYFLE